MDQFSTIFRKGTGKIFFNKIVDNLWDLKFQVIRQVWFTVGYREMLKIVSKHILGQDDFLIYTKTYIFSVALPKPVFLGL